MEKKDNNVNVKDVGVCIIKDQGIKDAVKGITIKFTGSTSVSIEKLTEQILSKQTLKMAEGKLFLLLSYNKYYDKYIFYL